MKKIFILFVPAILLVLAVYLSCFIVTESQYAVVTQFGKPVRVIKTPGLYFKRPGLLETVNVFDKRIRNFKTQPIQLLLGDKNPLILTCYVCWRIGDPLVFFQAVLREEVAVQRSGDMINSLLGSVLGDYKISNIINTDTQQIKLAEIENRIITNANEKARQKYGTEIVSIGISRVNYPSIVARAVYKRMQAEREKEAIRFRAEGYEQATRIRASTDSDVEQIMAEAYRKGEILKGEGDRKATLTYAKAYGSDPEFFEFTKSLDVYRRVLRNRATLVLSTESDLFKYLTHPGRACIDE